MAFEESPPFWWQKTSWQALLLSPFSWVYGSISARRMEIESSEYVSVPVICVGNFVAGGAGKTPTVLALAAKARAMGLKPGILSRGHGGGISAPTIVDLKKHDSRDVGDEPLLHAKSTITAVSSYRPAGAQLLVEAGCEIILMDDGFQNPSLYKDYCLVVVDAKRGIGNGFTHPAGPLRVPVSRQIPFADAILIIGEGIGADKIIRRAAKSAKPIQVAYTKIKNVRRLKGKWLLAFAGIADPNKFFESLLTAGAELIDRRAFGDHHHYHDEEIEDLLGKAKLQKLQLVSTSKDIARLKGLGELQQKLIAQTDVIEIELLFDDPGFAERVIKGAFKNSDQRKDHMTQLQSSSRLNETSAST